MNDYWVVTEKRTGKVIAHCGDECDAIMMFEFDPHNRSYRKQKFIMDQVIDITSTTDKQLPGQKGLPFAVDELPESEVVIMESLPEGQQKAFVV